MKLALFDLDHTLLNGDSEYQWGTYLIERGLIDPVPYRARHALFCEAYRKGILDIQELLQFQLEFLTRHPVEKLHTWRKEYVEEWIRPLLLPRGIEAIEQHHKRGDDLILITATNEFLTEPIAEFLGIKHLIASKVEIDLQGVYRNGVWLRDALLRITKKFGFIVILTMTCLYS